jgi:hypothetical protein
MIQSTTKEGDHSYRDHSSRDHSCRVHSCRDHSCLGSFVPGIIRVGDHSCRVHSCLDHSCRGSFVPGSFGPGSFVQNKGEERERDVYYSSSICRRCLRIDGLSSSSLSSPDSLIYISTRTQSPFT